MKSNSPLQTRLCAWVCAQLKKPKQITTKYWFCFEKTLVRVWIHGIKRNNCHTASSSEIFFHPYFVFCSSILPLSPPFLIHFAKWPTSFYRCGFENRQGEKCLKVLGIQLFQSMNLGRSQKSVLPFIVPRGKICTAKVRRVRQPMTCRLRSARRPLTSERNRDPAASLSEAGR